MLLFILLIQVGMIGSQRAHAKGNPRLKKIEWTDIWVANANQDDLPRILLIGGSIARGYFGAVEKDLAGKAYCARYTNFHVPGEPGLSG
jgi:hypothetical protein